MAGLSSEEWREQLCKNLTRQLSGQRSSRKSRRAGGDAFRVKDAGDAKARRARKKRERAAATAEREATAAHEERMRGLRART
jgi:hypothetical protein